MTPWASKNFHYDMNSPWTTLLSTSEFSGIILERSIVEVFLKYHRTSLRSEVMGIGTLMPHLPGVPVWEGMGWGDNFRFRC
jgi:hypothetical protein